MKAIVYATYGSPDVLELREVEPPVCGKNDVLVRVHAASVGAGDWHLLTATWFAVRLYQGLVRPKRPILGHDVSGTVEAVGSAVTRFAVGDQVFGASENAGCFAELVRVPATGLVHKPDNVTHEQAAAVPASALAALHGLRDKGRIRAGHKVLINGASGGVGTFAVQLAKFYGAEVTGVCSTSKLDLVLSIGADHVIDYRHEDFTQRDERYDLVLDNVGNRPLADCRRTLTPDGIYVAVSGAPTRALWIALFGGQRAVSFISQSKPEDLEDLRELLEAGQLTPVIERTYPLAEVADALRRLGAGQARGKLVIRV